MKEMRQGEKLVRENAEGSSSRGPHIFSLEKIFDIDESSGFCQLKELAHHFWGRSQCLCKCSKGHLCVLKHSLTGAT